jgi:hypothetical protein
MPQTKQNKKTQQEPTTKVNQSKREKRKRTKKIKEKVCGSGGIKEIHRSKKLFKTKRGIKKRVGKINK